jgi:PAS domain-containing protein
MEKVCAWCKKSMGTVEATAFAQDVITHGMCEECMLKMASGMTKSIDDFLDTLECPVLMLEEDNTFSTANQQACEILEKSREDLVGKKPGDVLECPHSKEPGGCGLQVHCKSCVIRQAVKRTYETGQACRDIPAIPDLQQFGSKKETKFLISTEKVGKMVLLRVERASPDATGF